MGADVEFGYLDRCHRGREALPSILALAIRAGDRLLSRRMCEQEIA